MKNTPNEKCSFRVRRISINVSEQINSDWSALYSINFKLDNSVLHLMTLKNIRVQFQNQPPIGWLKKYKTENKTLLYGTVTYKTELILHIVAIHIKALVVP